MDSIRKRIIQHLEESIKSVDEVRDVGFGSFEPSRLVKPCAGIIPDEDTAEQITHDDALEMQFKLIVRVVVEESFQTAGYELEDILPKIEQAIMADRTRDGAALDTRLTSTNWLFLDQQYPQSGADLNFTIQYLRSGADPSV